MHYETTNFFVDGQDFAEKLTSILPKKASENKDKQGRKRPMTSMIANALYNTPLNIKQFQKVARTYYKTKRIGNLVYLTSEINKNFIKIDFNTDLFEYIKIYVSRLDTTIEIPEPKYNSDLFKKIVNKNML